MQEKDRDLYYEFLEKLRNLTVEYSERGMNKQAIMITFASFFGISVFLAKLPKESILSGPIVEAIFSSYDGAPTLFDKNNL